jgi:hypothetical protein
MALSNDDKVKAQAVYTAIKADLAPTYGGVGLSLDGLSVVSGEDGAISSMKVQISINVTDVDGDASRVQKIIEMWA